MTLSERLQACAERVRQGWCQHRLHDGQGGVCAIGAMLAVDRGRRLERQHLYKGLVQQDLYDAMVRAVGFSDLVGWNNAPDQTAENVALAFELAALLADEQARQEPVPLVFEFNLAHVFARGA